MTAKATAGSAPRQRSPRPQRAPVPELPPMEALDRTHHQMLQVLTDLSKLIDHLENQGVDPAARASAQGICRFFADTARQHHANEETLVFPLLVRQGDKDMIQHVLRLQQDHGWLEEDWLELEPQLQAVAQGYSWYELDGLRAGVGVFAALYQDHIALEESMIYPAARAQMAAEAVSHDQRVAATGQGHGGHKA